MKLAYARLVTKNVLRLAAFYHQITRILSQGSAGYVEFRTDAATLAIAARRVDSHIGLRASFHTPDRPGPVGKFAGF